MIPSIVDVADVDDMVAPSAVIARVLLFLLVTAKHITLVIRVRATLRFNATHTGDGQR
jgi:hypothetical protein